MRRLILLSLLAFPAFAVDEKPPRLDPRTFDSGKSVYKKTRLSKAGNRHIRYPRYVETQQTFRQHPFLCHSDISRLVKNQRNRLDLEQSI
jgi:ribosomal protein L39E